MFNLRSFYFVLLDRFFNFRRTQLYLKTVEYFIYLVAFAGILAYLATGYVVPTLVIFHTIVLAFNNALALDCFKDPTKYQKLRRYKGKERALLEFIMDFLIYLAFFLIWFSSVVVTFTLDLSVGVAVYSILAILVNFVTLSYIHVEYKTRYLTVKNG